MFPETTQARDMSFCNNDASVYILQQFIIYNKTLFKTKRNFFTMNDGRNCNFSVGKFWKTRTGGNIFANFFIIRRKKFQSWPHFFGFCKTGRFKEDQKKVLTLMKFSVHLFVAAKQGVQPSSSTFAPGSCFNLPVISATTLSRSLTQRCDTQYSALSKLIFL